MRAKTQTLYCSKCDDEAHENHVEGKPFYYCRTCKSEVYSPSKHPRKKDIVELKNLNEFYVDTEGNAHCGHCTAKQGEAHSTHCTRHTRAGIYTVPKDGNIEVQMDLFTSPKSSTKCDHTATYAIGDQAWCLICNKDLS